MEKGSQAAVQQADSEGLCAGALYATNIGAFYPLGMEGWRFAFLSVGIVR